MGQETKGKSKENEREVIKERRKEEGKERERKYMELKRMKEC